MSTLLPTVSTQPTLSSRTLTRTVPLALGGILVASIVFAAVVPLVARAENVVPVDADSALVQTKGDLALDGTTIAGPVSVGGNLRFKGQSAINGGAVDVPVAGGGTRPVQLFVGGAPQWPTGSARLSVNGGGGLAAHDLTGTVVDDSGADIRLRPTGSATTDPSIRGGFDQPAATVPGADLLTNVPGQFAGYADRSLRLSTCAATVTGVVKRGVMKLTLTPGITNVWNVSEVDLDAISTLRLSPLPSPTTKLIVNVTGAGGDFSYPKYPLGTPDAVSSHILYNFVGTGSIRLTGVWPQRGTLYAPGFAVTSANPTELEGNLIAASFAVESPRGARLEIEDYPFTGAVDCGQPVVVPTTQVPTTTSQATATSTPTTSTASTPSGTASTTPTELPGTGASDVTTAPTTQTSTTADSLVTPDGESAVVATTTSTSSSGSTPGGDPTTTTTTTATSGETVITAPTAPAATAATTTATTSPVPTEAFAPATTITQESSEAAAATTTTTSTSQAQPDPGQRIAPTIAATLAASVETSTPTTTSRSAAVGSTVAAPGDPAGAAAPVVAPSGDPAVDPATTTATTSSGAVGSASSPAVARPAISGLAFSGADVAGLILTAVGLLAAGIGMTWTTRRQNAAGRHIA